MNNTRISSQKSTAKLSKASKASPAKRASEEAGAAATTQARAPKRQRGMDRVAGLLDAGSAVFAEKGYDAATMTEIAARAGAAIGSLYQFFPNKQALAGALVERYGERMGEALCAIREQASGMDASALAEALVGLMLAVRDERAAVVLVLETDDNRADEMRIALRDATRAQLAAILLAANLELAPGQAASRAVMVLHILKSIPSLAEEDGGDSGDGALVAEARLALQRYLT